MPVNVSSFVIAEEEVGSFLGQNESLDDQPLNTSTLDTSQPSSQGQFSTASFFQEPTSTNASFASTDPFQNVSQGSDPSDSPQTGSVPLMVPPQPPVSTTFDLGPPGVSQNVPPAQPFVPAVSSTPSQVSGGRDSDISEGSLHHICVT